MDDSGKLGLALCLTFLLLPISGHAQSIRTEIGLSGGLQKLVGEDFEYADLGFTLGGYVISREADPRIGLGVDFSQYRVRAIDEKVNWLDIYGTVRQMIPRNNRYPFFGFRGGFVRSWENIGGFRTSANGFSVGPVAGLRSDQTNPAIELEVSALFVKFGDAAFDGERVSGSDASGFRLVARLGVAFPVGQ